MRTHAQKRSPAVSSAEALDLEQAAHDASREADAVAAERSRLLSHKHSGQRLSPAEQDRLAHLTARLRELLPPISLGELEGLLEMAEEAENIRERARERRQRLGLG